MKVETNEKLEKLLNVIESCDNLEQFEVALRYAGQFPLEYQALNIVKMAIKRKAKEL